MSKRDDGVSLKDMLSHAYEAVELLGDGPSAKQKSGIRKVDTARHARNRRVTSNRGHDGIHAI